MNDINFDCPKCGQNLDAPPEMAGLFVECPACAAIVKVPLKTGQSSDLHPTTDGATEPAFVAPPPREEDKGSTMRIDLPPEFRLPPPTPRKFTIKRPGK